MKRHNITPLMIMTMMSFILIDGTVFSVYAVMSAIWHEMWHFIFLHILGHSVRHFELRGFAMKLSVGNIGYKNEAIVALAGPVASIVACGISFVWYICTPSRYTLFATVSNFFVGAVNILPIYPLDGGRALLCFASLKYSIFKSVRITKIISVIFLLPLAAVSVIILVRTGYNLSLLLICIYLAVTLMGVGKL